MPAAHSVHAAADVLPVALFARPAGHDLHIARPEASAYVPVGHAVHIVAPVSLSVPGAHAVHELAPEPLKDPAAHATHADEEALPVSLFALPAAQSVQTVLPVAAANEPTAHSTHVEACSPAL